MRKLLLVSAMLLVTSLVKADEGMWLLSKLNLNMDKMQSLGFKLTAEDVYSINQSSIKDAIVGLGRAGAPFRHFCSAEIISKEGLLLTNHHCAFSSIQAHSSIENNYLRDGFWAYSKSEELTNPGITASILKRMEDVTDRVNSELNDNMSYDERRAAVDSISKIIVAEATKDNILSGQVQSMFNGNQYFLFLYTIYKDVRLVGAPADRMGGFGGDTDNWMWPRHTADFSMYRIYTAPDGSPADYSADNVPLVPAHHLSISTKGVKEGDFAMVLGFPGGTDRYMSSFGLVNEMEDVNQVRYEVRTLKLDAMRGFMQNDEKVNIQYAAKFSQTANYWKYSFEQNKALRQLNTMGRKQEIESEFATWISKNPSRQKQYGSVLADLEKYHAINKKYTRVGTYVFEAIRGTEANVFAAATSDAIKQLCDDDVSSEKKDSIRKKLTERADVFYKDHNIDVDAELFAVLYDEYNKKVDAEYYPEIIKLVNSKYKGDYRAFANELKAKSVFMSQERFEKFIAKPSLKILEEDLAYIAGQSLAEMQKMLRSNEETSKLLANTKRLFVRGLMEMQPDKAWGPDANSTIRLTYGSVRAYKARDAVHYDYYTTLNGVLEKEGPVGGEFEIDEKLRTLYKAKDFAPYGDNTVVVNFITDNDITGGNSGSGVLNAEGHLIGTAFDGNSEAMSGDIDFEENLQRCINLDARYMLWIVDKVAGAKNLINEMTIIK